MMGDPDPQIADPQIADVLACPGCGGPLVVTEDALRCPADSLDFPRHPSGMLDLRLPDARPTADSFAQEYRAARLAEGWQPLDPAIAEALPDASPPGFTRLYWAVRRESWRLLAEWLSVLSNQPRLIADLGAGFPWLSHRLASFGHRIVAVDLSADADFGLGAARLFPTALSGIGPRDGLPAGHFAPILGDLERPPLAAGRYDAVICNASLHYARDLHTTVRRISAALRPGGAFVVVDSPVACEPAPGSRPGSRILGQDDLAGALAEAGLTVSWLTVKRGAAWWRHQMKNQLLRRAVFGFPLVIGRRDA
jgi:SAM-dependent methyltransferase